ncbi:hypothetical protein Pcinc_007068 [Petrolisthes cinctipes]|uniref:Uncharacterized protein n=1 Tax=Petrolisthes cinctipes TaxID=88211 RepID=A0AAE1L0W8_PETCI|nr:hypothetical protein Pcinc_007068 [Petrolisthes cinctipes]
MTLPLRSLSPPTPPSLQIWMGGVEGVGRSPSSRPIKPQRLVNQASYLAITRLTHSPPPLVSPTHHRHSSHPLTTTTRLTHSPPPLVSPTHHHSSHPLTCIIRTSTRLTHSLTTTTRSTHSQSSPLVSPTH